MPKFVVSPLQAAAFVADAQHLVDVDRSRFGNAASASLRPMQGPRYLRIVRETAGDPGQRSVFGFIDRTNGCVLRAAGWAGPDPIPRGNLIDPLDPSHGRYALTPQGIRHLGDPDLAVHARMLGKLRAKYAPETLSTRATGRPGQQGSVAPIVAKLPVGQLLVFAPNVDNSVFAEERPVSSLHRSSPAHGTQLVKLVANPRIKPKLSAVSGWQYDPTRLDGPEPAPEIEILLFKLAGGERRFVYSETRLPEPSRKDGRLRVLFFLQQAPWGAGRYELDLRRPADHSLATGEITLV
jgi:hypothetical protein